MAMTQDEKQKIINWLNQKQPTGFQCSVCNDRRWTVGDHVVSALVSEGGGIQIGGTNYPNVFLVCNNCGHTVYFNAVMLGVVKSG